MRIGSENRPDWLQIRHWMRFADAVAIKQTLVSRALSDMVRIIVPKAEELAAEFYDHYGAGGTVEKICSVIRKRAHKMG